MQDVIMKWKGEAFNSAVHGVDNVEIPQFTIVEYRTISTVEQLATGMYHYYVPSCNSVSFGNTSSSRLPLDLAKSDYSAPELIAMTAKCLE